ncbi:MAG TPA: hypothetical protein VGJ92_13480 [Methanocella sp.]
MGSGCIAALLAVFLIGPASAAIVPFNGVENSWLHHDDNGDPVADWVIRISDVAPVRNGDMLQFQNRWFNSYEGTTDLRISYGGELAGICTGADESVYYGLNYGNYYPTTGSVPFYSTVLACNVTPLYLMVTHQYVLNGIQYGTLDPSDKSLLFQWRYEANESRPDGTTPTPKPTNTNTNTSTPTRVPLPSQTSTSTPGFGFGSLIALAAALAIAHVGLSLRRKR